jgi:hypothetical protein
MRDLGNGKVVAALALALTVMGQARGQTSFKVPGIGGAAILADDQTLVVSATSEGTLIFFDTLADKETKRVEVDFQPTALAVQGDALFAATKGSATIHILDAASGKERTVVKVPGDPVIALSCHPKTGLLYAVNAGNEVFSIDPKTATANKTQAKGQLIEVDRADGKFVYTGIQKPIQDQLIIRRGPAGSATLSLAKANLRALMLQYAVDGRDLKLISANDNAAINGRGMGLSPDGKQVAMAGGGGWRSKTDLKVTYAIAVFDTSNMDDLLGQVETGPYPVTIAFHPTQNLGAAYHDGSPAEVLLFNAKSFAKKGTFKVQKHGQAAFLAFGGKGTKIVYVPLATGPRDTETVLEIFPLTPGSANNQDSSKIDGDPPKKTRTPRKVRTRP